MSSIGIIGIDYSMTSPAICFLADGKIPEFTYWTTKRKFECKIETDGHITEGKLFSNKDLADEERYDLLAEEIVTKSLWYWPQRIILEDYSFGSTGRATFNIGENVGVLKNRFHHNGVKLEKVAPTTVKKFATGKGNANKEAMQEAFINETGIDFKKVLGQTDSQWNPSSDLIDAYYIAKYAKEEL